MNALRLASIMLSLLGSDLASTVKAAVREGLTVSMVVILIANIQNPEGLTEAICPALGSHEDVGFEVPDFFAFLEGFGKSLNFTLELLDREFANEYLQMNDYQPHPPRALELT